MPAAQSYKNHNRWDPMYHFFIAPVLLANPIVLFVWHIHHPWFMRHLMAWMIVVSIAVLLAAAKTRLYALKAQDRAIRVEEKLRLAAVCSPAELAELESLTMKQYVALRFASNPELPELARRAVRETLTPKQIKEAIVSWRPDYDRV